MPSGSPSARLIPHITLIAGWPVTLKAVRAYDSAVGGEERVRAAVDDVKERFKEWNSRCSNRLRKGMLAGGFDVGEGTAVGRITGAALGEPGQHGIAGDRRSLDDCPKRRADLHLAEEARPDPQALPVDSVASGERRGTPEKVGRGATVGLRSDCSLRLRPAASGTRTTL